MNILNKIDTYTLPHFFYEIFETFSEEKVLVEDFQVKNRIFNG